MELPAFKEFLERAWELRKKIMFMKNDEYVRGGDRLSNFKVQATFRHRTPESMCYDQSMKHEACISDMINDLEKGIHHPLVVWEEKVGDKINFLFILLAQLHERYGEDEQYNHIE